MKPRIGVTSADDPLPDNYVAAIERCGGEAIILVNDLTAFAERLNELDGLVVTGGSDIAPEHYGASLHQATQPGLPERDVFELAAIRLAFEKKLPTLAICRGMQIANVAWGGTLHQHIPDMVEGTVVHDDPSRKFVAFDEHIVSVTGDSLLARLTHSTRFATNATHHQSVDRVGSGLRVVARTQDDVIEALEHDDAQAFWLATQWHPERLLDADEGRSLNILNAFIVAARSQAEHKKLPV